MIVAFAESTPTKVIVSLPAVVAGILELPSPPPPAACAPASAATNFPGSDNQQQKSQHQCPAATTKRNAELAIPFLYVNS